MRHIVKLFFVSTVLGTIGCGSSSPSPTPTSTPTTSTATYSGLFVVDYPVDYTVPGPYNTRCNGVRHINGTMTIALTQQASGSVTGVGKTGGILSGPDGSRAPCQVNFTAPSGPFQADYSGSVTGTASNFTWTAVGTIVETFTLAFQDKRAHQLTFRGSLNAGVITGSTDISETYTCTYNGASCFGQPLVTGQITVSTTLRP